MLCFHLCFFTESLFLDTNSILRIMPLSSVCLRGSYFSVLTLCVSLKSGLYKVFVELILLR